MSLKNQRLLGAHVSAAGGVTLALGRAATIGANCMQIFSGSPMIWNRLPLENLKIDEFYSKKQESTVQSVFTHSIYLLNLASENAELRQKSQTMLIYDLQFDSLIKGSGVVVHLGSHKGRGWEAVRDQVAEMITGVLAVTPADSQFLIENSAGQKGKLCSDLAEIRWLFDQIKSPRLGWCFDTCHGFAAGYALGESGSLDPVSGVLKPSITAEISRLQLWESLKCVHVNDSQDSFDSGRDRHANLGSGLIPSSELQFLVNYPQVRALPLILEVPGLDNNGPDQANLEYLRGLCQE